MADPVKVGKGILNILKGEKEAAKADGKVTAAERAKIQHDQNKANRHIAKEKHDRQERKR